MAEFCGAETYFGSRVRRLKEGEPHGTQKME